MVTDPFFSNRKRQSRGRVGAEFEIELRTEFEKPTIFSFILIHLQEKEMTKKEITLVIGLEKISGYFNRTIKKLLSKNLIERTIPGIPNHPAQKFKITERGIEFLEMLKK